MPDPADEGEHEMSEQVAERIEQRHVRVWFGEHVIAQYVAEPQLAARYAAAMDKRFAGLKITNEPILPLPSERLWGIPPQ